MSQIRTVQENVCTRLDAHEEIKLKEITHRLQGYTIKQGWVQSAVAQSSAEDTVTKIRYTVFSGP